MCLLALQGPDAEKILQPMVREDLRELRYFHFLTPTFIACAPSFAFLARTGYTGEDGFEICVPKEHAAFVWEKLLSAGAKPCGLGCRDTLRLEACMPLHGHEITEDITPLEAGLGWTVYWDKEFIGKNALLKQKEEGVKNHLIAFTMDGPGVPRAHYPILVNGAEAGSVTSGTFSPTLKKGIGVGYVNVPAAEGEKVAVMIHDQLRPATIVKKPFYKRQR
jgi:aminomethyltransferase